MENIDVAKDMNVLEEYLQALLPKAVSFVLQAVIALLVFWIATKVIKWLCKIFDKFLKVRNVDPSAVRFLVSLLRAVLYFFAVVTLAMQLGLKEASVVAALGSVGVGLGLALQGGMANLAGGVLILLLKPFELGDYIIESSHNLEGTVKKIDMFYTTLSTIDNKAIVIPNGQLTNDCVVNVTAQSKRQLDFKVMISYEDDLKKAKEILESLILEDDRILTDQEYRVFVDSLADHGVILGCRAWVSTSLFWDVYWDLNEHIKLAYDEADIHIPYNQLDVHVKKDNM